MGFLAHIKRLIAQFTGTTCTVQSNVGDAQLGREVSTCVFRVFQEALTNITRHAEAKHVDVRLDRRGGSLALEVRDDGKGIARESLRDPRSLGLLGIRERARRLGGNATIAAAASGGTIVSLTIPLAEAGAGSAT